MNNNNVSLTIVSGKNAFKATLQQVENSSKDTVSIGGKNYKLKLLVDKTKNSEATKLAESDFTKLAKQIEQFSWIKFESVSDFKQTLNNNTQFTAIDPREAPTVHKIGTEILKEKYKAVEQALAPMVQDRMQLKAARDQAKADLSAGKPSAEVSHNLCEGVKSLMAKMYKEGEAHLREQGLEPPCRYCVVGLGSLARDEAGPYPDFDNIIIVEHRNPDVEKYFLKLNQYVADRVFRLGESYDGNKPGLRFCWGNLNPQYEPYESRYSTSPTYRGRADLLIVPYKDPSTATVRLGDVRDGVPFYGNDERDMMLYDIYKKTVFPHAEARQQVRADMERQAKGLDPAGFPPSAITAPELPTLIHVKEDLCRLPAASIGALAVYHGITEPTTLGRIKALKEQGCLEPKLADDLSITMDCLIRWRIQAQSAHGEEFEFVASSAEALKAFEAELPQRIQDLTTKIAKLEAEPHPDNTAISNAKGQREFFKDCEKGIVKAVKDHPQAFTDADRRDLTGIVIPTLKELYKRVASCLPEGSTEIDPKAFTRAEL